MRPSAIAIVKEYFDTTIKDQNKKKKRERETIPNMIHLILVPRIFRFHFILLYPPNSFADCWFKYQIEIVSNFFQVANTQKNQT